MHKSKESDIIRNIRSWHPVVKNDWWIKFSVYIDQVLLFVVSTMTGETVVRYFNDEDEACEYINYILNQYANQPDGDLKVANLILSIIRNARIRKNILNVSASFGMLFKYILSIKLSSFILSSTEST